MLFRFSREWRRQSCSGKHGGGEKGVECERQDPEERARKLSGLGEQEENRQHQENREKEQIHQTRRRKNCQTKRGR